MYSHQLTNHNVIAQCFRQDTGATGSHDIVLEAAVCTRRETTGAYAVALTNI